MVKTATNGWGHFFLGTTTPSGLRALDARNSIQWLATFFLLALPPLLDLQHFLQIISQIILQFHPQPLDGQNSNQWLGTFFLGHYHPFWT